MDDALRHYCHPSLKIRVWCLDIFTIGCRFRINSGRCFSASWGRPSGYAPGRWGSPWTRTPEKEMETVSRSLLLYRNFESFILSRSLSCIIVILTPIFSGGYLMMSSFWYIETCCLSKSQVRIGAKRNHFWSFMYQPVRPKSLQPASKKGNSLRHRSQEVQLYCSVSLAWFWSCCISYHGIQKSYDTFRMNAYNTFHNNPLYI